MNTVINRIMEIEKQSAIDIAQAEDACRKNVEAHRRALDEEKERVQTNIIRSENDRLTQAVQALNKQIEEESLVAVKELERLFQDPVTVDALKEKIVAILLTE
ncbi:MAG: hypothetical protein JW902_07205 [Syntrophaceae bacterium]|nr:hypothetical protein [Syntrophaceae bacterium]